MMIVHEWPWILRSSRHVCDDPPPNIQPVRWTILTKTTQQQQPFYGPLSGTTRVSRYQKKHSPTHYPDHHPIFISFFHLPRSTASSLFKLRAWHSFFAQPLSMSSLVYLFVWSPPPHIPYISSPNQCLLFATHAHTIATCFVVVSILCHLFLVFLSLNYLLGTLSFTLTLHIHLTILTSARWSATSFSSWQARSHFHVTYYFAHNCYTASLS